MRERQRGSGLGRGGEREVDVGREKGREEEANEGEGQQRERSEGAGREVPLIMHSENTNARYRGNRLPIRISCTSHWS